MIARVEKSIEHTQYVLSDKRLSDIMRGYHEKNMISYKAQLKKFKEELRLAESE